MKTQTIFRSDDGKRFDTEADCLNYEQMVIEAAKANKILPQAVDDGCSFTNGGGYIQYTAENVARFEKETERLIREYISKEYADKYAQCPRGIVGRYLSDGGGPQNDLAYKLWTRRYCIDDSFREWGQPFYALNPDRGTQTELPTTK